MRALLLSLLIMVLGAAGGYLPAEALQPDLVAVASADSSYYVTWDFDSLGEGYLNTSGSDSSVESIVQDFGFYNTPLPNRFNDVLCDTYITFYSQAGNDIVATSANDLRGKGQVLFTGHWNWLTADLVIQKVTSTTWEVSQRLYDYLLLRKNLNDYCVSIAIYSSASDAQLPLVFPDSQKSAGGFDGTLLNFSLSTTVDGESVVPGFNTGDFTDTSDKSEDGIIDDSGELGGTANTTKPIASGTSTLDKIKTVLGELLGKSVDTISTVFAVSTIIVLSLLGLTVLLIFVRIFRFLLPRK